MLASSSRCKLQEDPGVLASNSCGVQALRNVGALSRILHKGQKLPEAYVWTENERPEICHDDYQEEQLPVIDLSELLGGGGCSSMDSSSMTRVCNEIRAACEDWGAFQVINHGVATEVVERARMKALELFALPEDDKLRAERPAGTLFGYGATRMASFFDRLMWSEAFTMMGSPHSNINDYARKLWRSGSNNGFCNSFEDYDAAMRNLALVVTRPILHALGATHGQVDETSSFWGLIHMNYYPPCPNPSEAMGLASHTDSSCLTIMHQGNVGGLQVKRGNKWIAVKPQPNAFVIQVGDILQVMSNDAFQSALHRAVVNDKLTRLSLVYFFIPPPSATIAPFALSRQSLYRSLTWNEYLQAKTKHFMGALDHFRLPEK